MARVFPGSDFKDVYDARNIYTTNIQGDDYKVRRSANDSNLDPRTNSEFQNKIIDAFSIASRIWKNKRECWKDHFRRGHKIFRYNELGAQTLEKDLSGYHLAMNILIQTLKTDKGEYYDPNCFCITPTDLFGEPLNTYSVLDILQKSKIDYEYREKKLTYDILQPEGQQYNRFRSAVFNDPDTLNKCILSSVGCISRDNTLPNGKRDITLVKNIVQWPNFWFRPVDHILQREFGIWDNEYFTYEKIRTEDLVVTDGSMRGVIITLGHPFTGGSLCNLNNLQLTILYQYDRLEAGIKYTGTGPFFDLYYGDQYLGRFGNGGGVPIITPLNLNNNYLDNPSPNKMRWSEHINPVIPGYQPSMYPPGKLSECRLVGIELGEKSDDPCFWRYIYQIWEAPEPIDFRASTPNVRFKVNIWAWSQHTGGIQEAYPFGAFDVQVSNDRVNWIKLSRPGMIYTLNGTGNSYCFGTDNEEFALTGSYKYFRTRMWTSFFGIYGSNAGTFFGDPVCQPMQIDDQCLGPSPGQRGLFILELEKEFVTRPVACRCPEYSCPISFPQIGSNSCTLSPIRGCPDNPSMALIGDDCVPCIGPSPHGLVYDHLI